MRSTRRGFLALPVATSMGTGLAASLGQLLAARSASAQAVGTPLKVFAAPQLDGTAFVPASLEGKVTLLYAWASWCPYCLRDLPALRDRQEELRSKGFVVLGVNADKDVDLALAWIKNYKVNFSSVRLTADYRQTYFSKGVATPAWWLAGRDGVVVDSAFGGGAEFVYRQRIDVINRLVAQS